MTTWDEIRNRSEQASLFDLEASTIDTGASAVAVEQDEFSAETVDVEQIEPEVFDPVPIDAPGDVELPPEFEPDEGEEPSTPKPVWQRLASLLVPIGVVVYVLISALADR